MIAGQATQNIHIAFSGNDDDVRRFHPDAATAGYRSNGEPGERARYHVGYYTAFVLDPDGNNIEVVNHDRWPGNAILTRARFASGVGRRRGLTSGRGRRRESTRTWSRRSVLGREPLLGDLLLGVDERHLRDDRVAPGARDLDFELGPEPCCLIRASASLPMKSAFCSRSTIQS